MESDRLGHRSPSNGLQQSKSRLDTYPGLGFDDSPARQKLHSTLRLKVYVILWSTLSFLLIALAAAQSSKYFITLGYAPVIVDNRRTAVTNAVVAVYGALTGIVTRLAVTKCMELISIKALSTNGRFLLAAKTWAYMAHANGKWYTIGPLFLAGLVGTAVIAILPTTILDAGHFVYLDVMPVLRPELNCLNGGAITPSCRGPSIASDLMHTFSFNTYTNENTWELSFSNRTSVSSKDHISSNGSLGYPYRLANDRSSQLEKYNIHEGQSQGLRETNKTSCVWVLDKNPMRCSWANYTLDKAGQLTFDTPWGWTSSALVNETVEAPGRFSLQGNWMQERTLNSSPVFELYGVGVYHGYVVNFTQSNAYTCINRDPAEVAGRYLMSQWNGFVNSTSVDLANTSSCIPKYALPDSQIMLSLVKDMRNGIDQFAATNGWNPFIQNLGYGSYSANVSKPIFHDSTSQFEDSMGAFMSLLLSGTYNVTTTSAAESSVSDSATRVEGGQAISTVGLGSSSPFYAWLILALVPVLTTFIAALMPLDYLPEWDVMNTMDALATPAVMDDIFAEKTSRSTGIRLGLLDGRVVASNTNAPIRLTKPLY